ncbi:MAG: hypothetical protein K1X28_00480 [Parachlamydiales bacterium]|nr:hypothetical protein [Parachlamydiales bacterium]
MAEVSLDLIDDDRFDVRGKTLGGLDTVNLSEREDQDTIVKTKKAAENFMTNIYRVMPFILADQHRSGEKSKREIHLLEAGIKKATLLAADLQGDLGWNGLKSAGLVMAVSLLQFVPGCNDVDKQIVNLAAKEVAPNIMGMSRHGIEGNLTRANNDVTLKNNKYNLLSTQEQSRGNQRQEMTAILDKANRLLESASRAG